jgi:hypothetical protein
LSGLAVILPQPKKAPSQWIENLSMSALAIEQQLRFWGSRHPPSWAPMELIGSSASPEAKS